MTPAIDQQIVYDFTAGRNGRIDAVIDAAGQLGRDAKASALKHVVRPALNAVHHAKGTFEETAHQATAQLRESVALMEEKVHSHPRYTLGAAFGIGVIVGLILFRR